MSKTVSNIYDLSCSFLCHRVDKSWERSALKISQSSLLTSLKRVNGGSKYLGLQPTSAMDHVSFPLGFSKLDSLPFVKVIAESVRNVRAMFTVKQLPRAESVF